MTHYPDYIVPTGDFVAEWMEDEGVNAAELARRLDVSRKHVSELLHGKAPLSHDLALRLENVTGVPGYREALARRRAAEDLAGQFEQAKAFPLSYLRKSGVIAAGARDKAGTVKDLLRFFEVGTFDAFQSTWEKGSVAYRRSAVGRDDAPALAAWLRLAERDAHMDSLAEGR